MAGPKIVPRVKTETKTIHTPISKCGEFWYKPVRVRSPYRGFSGGYRTLPSLGYPDQIKYFDPLFIGEIVGDHKRIANFTEATRLNLSIKQLDNVTKMLKRAYSYTEDAQRIADAWARGFSAPRAGAVPPWPLGGHPQAPVGERVEEGHRRDEAKYKKLLFAALRNLRCAEEVSKKASIRAYNKIIIEGRSYSGIMTENNTAGFSAGIASRNPRIGDDEELDDGEIILDEESSEPTSSITPSQKNKKKKKNDNTLLIAGAAVLGIFAMKR